LGACRDDPRSRQGAGEAQRRAIIAMEAARIARNRAEYEAQPVTGAQLDSIRWSTAEVLAAAHAFVRNRCAEDS
jgi:hypothetical protein